MPVLLSTATDLPLNEPLPQGVQRRIGRLDAEGMVRVIREFNCRVVVDASHPYAEEVSRQAAAAAQKAGVPYTAYDRPSAVPPAAAVIRVVDHVEAARTACRFKDPILLTIGTNHLAPYVTEARRGAVRLVVRILDVPESWMRCRRLGLKADDIVAGRGSLGYDQMIDLLRSRRIGVLVTKDSGLEGGVPIKLKAAEATECRVVVIERPPRPQPIFNDIAALIDAVERACGDGRCSLGCRGRSPQV